MLRRETRFYIVLDAPQATQCRRTRERHHKVRSGGPTGRRAGGRLTGNWRLDSQFFDDDALGVRRATERVGLQVGQRVRLGVVEVVPPLGPPLDPHLATASDTGWLPHLKYRSKLGLITGRSLKILHPVVRSRTEHGRHRPQTESDQLAANED